MSKTQSFNPEHRRRFTIMQALLGIDLALRASRQHYLQLRMDGCWLQLLWSIHSIILIPAGLSRIQRTVAGHAGAIRGCLQDGAKLGIHAEDVRGLGLSGQMHGVVLLDENAQVLRPSIIWADQRH